MGRMADARKRAKRTEPSPDATPVEAVPVNPPPAEPEESRDDADFTFPPQEPAPAAAPAAAPVRDERKAVEATEHLASFFLAGEEYAVDVRMVQEIIRVTEITQVPRAPAFIKGVINLRGRIIPVVDLKRKLGLGDVEVTKIA